jgi:hypothetical protein
MKLVLHVRSCEPASVTDSYEDGSFQSFDSLEVDVVEGPRSGEHWRVLVESLSPEAKRWNRPGQTLRVSIDPEQLDSQVLFAPAFTIEQDTSTGTDACRLPPAPAAP